MRGNLCADIFDSLTSRVLFSGGTSLLLHVRNLPVQKCHLDVFVDVNLLASEIDDLVGNSDGSLHLIRRLTLFDLLRLWWGTLLRLSSSAAATATTLVVSALIITVAVAIAIAALAIALIAGAVVECQQAGHYIFYLGWVRIRQRALWKLKHNICLVESRGADVIARIASDDTHQNLVFRQVHGKLGWINLLSDLHQSGGLLLPKLLHAKS